MGLIKNYFQKASVACFILKSPKVFNKERKVENISHFFVVVKTLVFLESKYLFRYISSYYDMYKISGHNMKAMKLL